MRRFHWCILSFLCCFGCSYNPPKGITPINNFNKEAYLGKWYEIARLDHSFERGLTCVSATYESRADGGIKVINRGFNATKDRWSDAEGRGYLVGKDNIGQLKVSFFGPFYGSYIIFYLDDQSAYITSNTKDYLWYLSRTPKVSKKRLDHFKSYAKKHGFNIDQLIIVDQSC
jgi:apolipoprotein D and lipocalin family protein|tara:strand:+ start:447 stop:962 length:516 start_codon:yes stop_codon:yes gene_type:complete